MESFIPTRNFALQRSGFRLQPQVTVVHRGARDAYQVTLALEEAGMLVSLVTDIFWPSDKPWAHAIARILPAKIQAQLRARSQSLIPSFKVKSLAFTGLATLLVDKLVAMRVLPPGVRRATMRRTDSSLGRFAGHSAQKRGTGLLSYSYYACDAFAHYGGAGILFQLHPHPASMRRILLKELANHPQCADSLNQEWEIALPKPDYDRLVSEPACASHIIAASSFTRQTLVENGIDQGRITVIPYGVDSKIFLPDASRLHAENEKLRILFVGRMNQRKGIQYLLESLKLIGTDRVQLTICGRVVDDLAIFRPFREQVLIRPDVSHDELVAAYQSADLFVFPSVAEGFGQVLLESLACGLPVLSTTRTAAPDLIESGREGFIVEPCDSAPIADRLEWALVNRRALRAMRIEARRTAEDFSWQRFRSKVAQTVADQLGSKAVTVSDYERRLPDRSEVHVL